MRNKAYRQENNPDADRAVLVLLYNVAIIVVRLHPLSASAAAAAAAAAAATEAAAAASTSTPGGAGDADASAGHAEVVMFGVDKVPFSGFHFYSGGVEAFLEAISSEVVLKKIGTKEAGRGRRDTTFNVLLQGTPSNGGASSVMVPPPIKAAAKRPSRGLFSALSRMFSSEKAEAEEDRKDVGERVDDFVVRWANRRRLRAFLAWRIHAYRRRKVKQKVRKIMKDDIVKVVDSSGSGGSVDGGNISGGGGDGSDSESAFASAAAGLGGGPASLTAEVWESGAIKVRTRAHLITMSHQNARTSA